jgi:hypothetical protein
LAVFAACEEQLQSIAIRRQVIAQRCFEPIVGSKREEQWRIGATEGIGYRVVFADFSSRGARKNISQK